MFEIGFWEITLIGVIALLVIGPERLPRLARDVGLWVGRIRRYVAQVKNDIEREVQAEELKKMLDRPDAAAGLGDVVRETRDSLNEARREIESADRDDVKDDVKPAAAGTQAAQDQGSTAKAAASGDWTRSLAPADPVGPPEPPAAGSAPPPGARGGPPAGSDETGSNPREVPDGAGGGAQDTPGGTTPGGTTPRGTTPGGTTR